MKKLIWIPLIILIIGVCIALAGFAAGGMKGIWLDRAGFHLADADLGKVISVDESYDGFTDISVDADYLHRIVLKEGDAYAVRGKNYERFGGLKANLSNGRLTVEAKQDRIWSAYNRLFDWTVFNDSNSWLEITYPKGAELGNVNVKTSAGNIDASGLACVGLDAKNDFGDLKIGSVRAKSLTARLSAGDISVTGATADTFDVENDFGKVSIDDVSAASVSLKLSAGDLEAKGVAAGNLTAKDDFGKISMSRLVFTGRCDVSCSAGDVYLDLQMAEEDMSYELRSDVGSVTVDGRKENGSVGGSVISRAPGADASLMAITDFGAVRVSFSG